MSASQHIAAITVRCKRFYLTVIVLFTIEVLILKVKDRNIIKNIDENTCFFSFTVIEYNEIKIGGKFL